MLNQIKKFMLDESGLETVEWAIVGGVIVAVGAALFLTIGADVLVGVTALDTATSGINP
jgi:pilus assembly protein Flp/PilA